MRRELLFTVTEHLRPDGRGSGCGEAVLRYGGEFVACCAFCGADGWDVARRCLQAAWAAWKADRKIVDGEG